MKLEYYGKGVHFSAKEMERMARKLGKMATYCSRLKDESSVIRLEAERRETKKANDEVKVMINVELPQKMFRAESRKATMIEALDRAVEKLEPQLVKYKELRTSKGRARKARKQGRVSSAA